PFLHAAAARLLPFPCDTVCFTPLNVMFERSAVPCTSISTLTDWMVPVGVAAVNVYVTVPSAFVVGVTLLQPSGKRPSLVTTTKRGEPPWHWEAFASVNDADWNACPSAPVMSAPAAAFVGVGQGFARCSTPLL